MAWCSDSEESTSWHLRWQQRYFRLEGAFILYCSHIQLDTQRERGSKTEHVRVTETHESEWIRMNQIHGETHRVDSQGKLLTAPHGITHQSSQSFRLAATRELRSQRLVLEDFTLQDATFGTCRHRAARQRKLSICRRHKIWRQLGPSLEHALRDTFWKLQLVTIAFLEWSPAWHFPDIVSEIPSGNRHGIYINILNITSDMLSGTYSDILPDIFSDILSGAYSDILSGIYSDILSGIFSGIHSGILTVYLAFILTFFLAFYLAFCLASILTFYLPCILTFYLTFCLTFYVHSQLRSGSAHCCLQLAVEELEDEKEKDGTHLG